jgi:hypothetical protein
MGAIVGRGDAPMRAQVNAFYGSNSSQEEYA